LFQLSSDRCSLGQDIHACMQGGVGFPCPAVPPVIGSELNHINSLFLSELTFCCLLVCLHGCIDATSITYCMAFVGIHPSIHPSIHPFNLVTCVHHFSASTGERNRKEECLSVCLPVRLSLTIRESPLSLSLAPISPLRRQIDRQTLDKAFGQKKC